MAARTGERKQRQSVRGCGCARGAAAIPDVAMERDGAYGSSRARDNKAAKDGDGAVSSSNIDKRRAPLLLLMSTPCIVIIASFLSPTESTVAYNIVFVTCTLYTQVGCLSYFL